jgi:hypothetical protein
MGNYWMVSSPYHHHTPLEPIQIGTNSGRVMLPFKRRTGVSLLYDIKKLLYFRSVFHQAILQNDVREEDRPC